MKVIRSFEINGKKFDEIGMKSTARGLKVYCVDENGEHFTFYKKDILKKYGVKKAIEMFNSPVNCDYLELNRG